MKQKKTEVKIEIYLILSQVDKEFYVWKTKAPNSYQAYKDHANLRYGRTKPLFEKSELMKKFPQMYILETITATGEQAFRHCIAWTKYFIEHGYQPLSNDKIVGYTEDLLEETSEIFESICETPLDKVLCKERMKVENFSRREAGAKMGPRNQIKISVSEEEYVKIHSKATKLGFSLSKYCKNMVLNGRVITVESPYLSEHTAVVREAKIILKYVLCAIYQNKCYYPADLENIQKAVEMIVEAEETVAEAYEKNTDVLLKLLSR